MDKKVTLTVDQKFKKGLKYYDVGDYDKAEKMFKQVIKESKDMAMLIQANNCLAEILLDQERYKDARKSVDFVLKNAKEGGEFQEEREAANEFLFIIENEM